MSLRNASKYLTAATALLLAMACADDSVESKYSNLPASFIFSPVTSAPPLNAALNGFGEFCAIRINTNQIFFSSLTSAITVNRSDIAAYQSVICIGGFIVGRSSVNEIGTAEYPLVCYDLACPNCYRNDNIAKPLSFEENGICSCARCNRTYDMNNGGMILSGSNGKKLIRYRMSYSSNTLVINN